MDIIAVQQLTPVTVLLQILCETLEHDLFLFLQVSCQRTVLHDRHHLFMDDLHQSFLFQRIGVKLHDQLCFRRRDTTQRTIGAYTVRTTLALTNRLQVTLAQHTTYHADIQTIRQAVRNIVRGVLDEVRSRRSLHLTTEIVLLLTQCHRLVMINHTLLAVLLRLQTAQPLTDQFFGLRVIRIDITYEYEGKVSRVGKTCFIHCQRFIQTCMIQQVLIEE